VYIPGGSDDCVPPPKVAPTAAIAAYQPPPYEPPPTASRLSKSVAAQHQAQQQHKAKSTKKGLSGKLEDVYGAGGGGNLNETYNIGATLHEQPKRDTYLFTGQYVPAPCETSSGEYSPRLADDELGFTLQGAIRGTCKHWEKDYLRLTEPPKPSEVRPLKILERAFSNIEQRWSSGEILAMAKEKFLAGGRQFSPGNVEQEALCEAYQYACSQMKSIRQDLMVQHIVTDFTVRTFELHARIALECADLNEFNQCQTQLKQMYKSCPGCCCECEFLAYRVLYFIYLRGNQQYKAGNSDLTFLLQDLSAEEVKHPAVRHALETRAALQQENLTRFFRLYRSTPNKGKYVLDMMLNQQRLKFLQRAMKAYGASNVAGNFVIDALVFDSLLEGYAFLERAGCVFTIGSAACAGMKTDALVKAASADAEAVQIVCKESDIAMDMDADALL